MRLGKRARAFPHVFAPVFEEYQKRLEGRTDFEDMILRAMPKPADMSVRFVTS